MPVASFQACVRKVLFSALLLLYFLPAAGSAAVVSLLETENVVGDWELVQRPDASFSLTWVEGPLADGSTALRLRRFDATGSPLASTITIEQTQLVPFVNMAVDALGNELIVLLTGERSGEITHYEVRLLGRSPEGAELWPGRVLAEISGAQDTIAFVDVVAAPSGGWIVVWAEYRAGTVSQWDLFSSHVALADGASSPRIAVASAGQVLDALALASDGAHPLAVWREGTPVVHESRLVGRALDGVGAPISEAVDLLRLDGGALVFGPIDADAVSSGSYFISWPQSPDAGPTDIFGFSYSPGAPPLPPVHLVHQTGGPFEWASSLAVDRQGRAMVSWVETPPDAAYPTTVVRQGRDLAGNALTDLSTVATYVGLTSPRVSATDDGAWVVGWSKQPLLLLGQLGGIKAELGAFRNDCEEDGTALCLTGGRFRVSATFHDHLGRDGVGQAVALTPESGTFWFFTSANVELIVKVVDACGHPDFRDFWVYASGLTDVEVELTVVDTWTGEIWERATDLGEPFPPILDSQAFHTCDATAMF